MLQGEIEQVFTVLVQSLFQDHFRGLVADRRFHRDTAFKVEDEYTVTDNIKCCLLLSVRPCLKNRFRFQEQFIGENRLLCNDTMPRVRR